MTGGGAGPATETLLSDLDRYLFNEGSHSQLYEKLGAHPGERDGRPQTTFAVWAPNAATVSVIGDFNAWDRSAHPLAPLAATGVWAGTLPGVGPGACYKYHVVSRHGGYTVDKCDPFAFHCETPPRTASLVWQWSHRWGDTAWMAGRGARQSIDAPLAIYEVHLGSWMRPDDDAARFLTYREVAPRLAAYVRDMGFTHVELLPVTEHPFYGSWGYQTTGYFAPTARYGTPDDFMFLVDVLHQHGIGVILDWVPSHFPTDEHGLSYFDGTHLYEHADPRQGFHPDWGSLIFNYGRDEVRAFLLSSARFWLERYHIDGLRVDAVASMLYLDYSRRAGEWIPNRYGGRENLEAIDFLRTLNREVLAACPDVQTVAEESTAWPMVSRPAHLGGLGFGFKWDMGWMHDTLEYMRQDPIHRRFHHHRLTFRTLYAFSENFVLPLSHDEVVHGKGSLLGKMPGDEWQRAANLRLLLGWLYTQPGKKLLFMGGEFGQPAEWGHDRALDWQLLGQPTHRGLQRWTADLNRLYVGDPCLHQRDCRPDGFAWVDCSDSDQSVVSFLRRGDDATVALLVACNFTPVPRHGYRIGVPWGGAWNEVLNSDARDYGGSGQGNYGGIVASAAAAHGRGYGLEMTLPPLAIVVFRGVQPGATPPANCR
jgi:1,4-alpha-glucan branching enzyme